MNRGQRTGHGRIWGILFLVMPLLLFWALSPVIPTDEITPPLVQQMEMAEKKMPVEISWDSVLVVEVHTPLESAATGVLINAGQADEYLAGQIEGANTYRFYLSEKPTVVVLMDLIKKKELYRLQIE